MKFVFISNSFDFRAFVDPMLSVDSKKIYVLHASSQLVAVDTEVTNEAQY